MELKSGDFFYEKFLWKVKIQRGDYRRKNGGDEIAKRIKC